MKRLSVFSIRSFIGPFLVTFAISMFILIMQFFWKYIDDLMGKGIDAAIILELLFYVSASLIPLALPLAILLSSVMTLGNLAENNELTALKSSGLSLYRIIRPLSAVIFVIAIGTFYFANYIIPMANFKWHSIIFDIQNTKIATIITPGVYNTEIEGYAIKVKKELDDGTLKGVIIHDKTKKHELKTIRAEEGNIYKSNNGKSLFFNLKNGSVNEELETKSPSFTSDGRRRIDKSINRPSRRSTFKQATYQIDLSGFALNRSDDQLFKDDYEMLTVFQLSSQLDSVINDAKEVQQNFLKSLKNNHEYYQSIHFPDRNTLKKMSDSSQHHRLDKKKEQVVSTKNIDFDSLQVEDQLAAVTSAISKIENKLRNIDGQNKFITNIERNIDRYWIEFHRKFALTFAIVVLFFVGAPLGAIVKKGGFGAPVVIAALLFMIYFVLITIGENLVVANVVSPFVGMWFATLVLTPIAFILMRAAANDSAVFDSASWKRFFTLKWLKR